MSADYPGAFRDLRALLAAHATGLRVVADTPTDYTVATLATTPAGKPMWFGQVLTKKTAVTFHLLPLYFNPVLEAAVPAELAARKQGKTCFHFQRPDPVLFALLDTLVARGRAAWARAGFLEAGPVSQDRLAAALQVGGTDPTQLAARREAALAKRTRSPRAPRRK